MCDDTGLFQHAVHSVPDRAHGYCVDDNARALLLACALERHRRAALAGRADRALRRLRPACLEPRHEALPQFHELRPALARGQRLGRQPRPHALGARRMRAQRRRARRGGDGPPPCSPKPCRPSRASARRAPGPSRCSAWMPIAPPPPDDRGRASMRDAARRPADRRSWRRSRREDWVWFEDGLAYDNARLPQALIVTGICDGRAGLCRGRPAIAALADDAADRAGGPLPAGRHGRASATGASAPQAVRPAAAGGDGDDLGLPRRLARRRRSAMDGPTPRAPSPGSSARTTCRRRWSTSTPAAAATACIPTAPTRTAAANPSSPICSASPRSGSSPASSGDRPKLRAASALARLSLRRTSHQQTRGAIVPSRRS